MLERLMGVFRLDANTFEEIEHSEDATMQAVVVVAIVAIVGSIGAVVGAFAGGSGAGGVLLGVVGALLNTFIGWIVWAFATYIVGTMIFGGKADMGEMIRVTGFAYAPQVLAIIPCIGLLIGFIWTAAAMFIAIRQGLDLDNGKTIFTVLVGFVLVFIISFVVNLIFGGAGALFGSLTSAMPQ